uniref:origin recognition complex subunit 3 n=1 Tax=Ciona intestinalis TaxID=7719 RepID=UPI0005212C19|nr:origin recognition complex subunit 3 [Ciona intestinalis]|eukprot:XP_002121235.3 origin recognition complex subunit 3 [Ciona intestinalis]
MNDESTTSVSKGCFVIKAKKSPEILKPENFLSLEGDRSKLRWEIGQKVWEEIENRVDEVHGELKEGLFNGLLSFVENAHSVNHGNRIQIPTAALVTGVNIPDHSELFSSLKSKVTTNVSPHVVLLHSKQCLTMKSMMKVVSRQLIAKVDDTETQSEGENEDDADLEYMKKKFSAVTMTMVRKWYEKQLKPTQSSPSKKKQPKLSVITRKPIVIIFQDLEMFNPNILIDFILMCSFHSPFLPFVLILGIATSWLDVSQRLLPHSASIHLAVRKFLAPTSSSHLALIMDRILLNSDLPFKLSGRSLQLLLDVFLCNDFSILNFLHSLRYCVLKHFQNQPASVLCSLSPDKLASIVAKLTKSELNSLRNVASVKQFISNESNLSLSKDSNFRKEVLQWIKGLRIYFEVYFPVLRSLHALTMVFTHHPMGKQLREVFCLCYKSGVENNDGFKQTLLLLKVTSKDQLMEVLQSCIIALVGGKYSENVDTQFHPLTAVEKFRNFILELENLNDTAAEEEGTEEIENEPLETVKYAYQLQERIRNRSKQKKRNKMTKFEKLQEAIINYLKGFFEFNLRPVVALPLHEAFYFDDTMTIKQHKMAAPRFAIQKALSDPGHYLNLQSISEDIATPEMPDICIAYKLHTESASIINLYDWMTAFHTIVHSSEETCSEIDEITQARFIRAVSELQLLGFIKPTKRKTDHVQRLTWCHG